MTTTIDHSPAGEPGAEGEEDSAVPRDGEAGGAGPEGTGQGPRVAVALLAAHPGNVRQDLALDAGLLAAVRELGVLVPLRVTPDGDGFRVIEGHRRLAAAIEAGLAEVPCDVAAGRAGDEAAQFLDMYALNHHRRGLTALEEADALFAASAAGASRTRIRKATGLGKEEVSAALAAGRLAGAGRDAAAALGYDATLDQLALLAEFDGDDGATGRLMSAFLAGRSGEHAAQAIRAERAEAAAHAGLVAELQQDGYQVTGTLPAGATLLSMLQHDGEPLTPGRHAGCPGRAVTFYPYAPLEPVHYCTDPAGNFHYSRYQASPLSLGDGPGADDAGCATAPLDPGPSPAPDPARRLVIEGNRAWTAACTVRHKWITGRLLTRRSAPKEAMPFIAAQVLSRPSPVQYLLGHASGYPLFGDLTSGTYKASEIAGWPAGRLPLALLAAVITCYEEKLASTTGKMTWRTDRPTEYNFVTRDEAGTYFRFLATTGYELATIEQAVADGVPYTGERAGDELTADGGQDPAGQDGTLTVAPCAADEGGSPGEDAASGVHDGGAVTVPPAEQAA